MKTYINATVLSFLFMIALTTQVSAQTRSNGTKSNKKQTVSPITTTKKTTVTKRVSSTKITYKTPKKKVVSVRNVPNKTIITNKGQNYYYANNKYYMQSGGRYIEIAPKVGFKVNVLPQNYKKVRFNNHDYYNSQGIFYININNQYEVVEPEIGTLVYELPDDYEKVSIDGQTYYEYANIIYEKIQVNGSRAYKVIGIVDME